MTARLVVTFAALLLIAVALGCSLQAMDVDLAATAHAPLPTDPAATPTALSYVTTDAPEGSTSLRCEGCRTLEVLEVIGPDIVVTPEGQMRLYGAFVPPEEEECVEASTARLTELASGSVRVEEGSLETDSSGTPIRYLYTESGDSIDEIFVSEGLARRSAFEGPHAPWLLVTADNARRERSGCIWAAFDRMFPQRTPRPSGGLN